MTVKVSVVMPAFNAGSLLYKALASIDAQTFRDLEVILVDDASSDATAEKAREILAATDLNATAVQSP